MERKEEEESNIGNIPEEPSSSQSNRDSSCILNYDKMNVRNLKLDEILNRMSAFRQQTQSLEIVADSSGPSTSTQEWSSSAPSTSKDNNSSRPERRLTFSSVNPRQNSPPEMILNQLPAGCKRSAPSSPMQAACEYLPSLLVDEEASTSRSDCQNLPNPVNPESPVVSPRKISRPGHPFGLGSDSRLHSAKDLVPIEFVKSDDKDEPGVLDKKAKIDEVGKKEKLGQPIEKGSHGDNTGVHGEPNIKEK